MRDLLALIYAAAWSMYYKHHLDARSPIASGICDSLPPSEVEASQIQLALLIVA